MSGAAPPSPWLARAWGDTPARDAQTRAEAVDVVVVGGGLTGLWTAYYLVRDHPGLDVLVLEAERVGFGASGRNGGWCSALFPAAAARVARRHGEAAARDLRAAMRATVREVGEVTAAEGIDCGFVRGGTVTVARTAAQLTRLRAHAAEDRHWGDATQVLDAQEARTRLAADGALGGTWNPDCARLDPGLLVTGLARTVERLGARVREGSRVVALRPDGVDVTVRHGDGDEGRGGARAPETVTVRARHVVRATEAWTTQLPGRRRAVVPVYSLMVATEPLPAGTWAAVGLDGGETFTDGRHLVVYGQRTADGRIAFGGRGAPYHWGSALRPGYDLEPRVHRALERTLVDLLPALRGVRVTHRWGGPLGVPRDWHASMGVDDDGVAWAGGYVGDGVATTNLAGRTLADLLTGRATALTALPWVGHRSPPWEPEPLRWAGVTAGALAVRAADAEERLTGRPSKVARVMAPLIGG